MVDWRWAAVLTTETRVYEQPASRAFEHNIYSARILTFVDDLCYQRSRTYGRI